jgi:hypothetical protein
MIRRVSTRTAALLAACLALAAMLLSACGSSAPIPTPAFPSAPGPELGINGWYLFYEMPQLTWNGELSAMAADHVRVVRADAAWEYVEPTAPSGGVHSYNWTKLDAIAGALARHRMRWLPIIDYSTTWSESVPGNLRSPPADVADFAAYAAELVRRYGRGGSFWKANPAQTPRPVTAVEIWNEPNAASTAIPAAAYARLYEAARTAVHAVNPSAQAIIGGLGNPAATYVDQMYATLGGPGRIDAVAAHPYDLMPSDTIRNVVELRDALDAEGDDNVPIDVTEFGWPTSGSAAWTTALSDRARAAAITQVINTLAHSDCGIQQIIPYAWVTSRAMPANVNDWFGLVGPGGAATQSSTALGREYAALESASFGGEATQAVCSRALALRLSQASVPRASSANLCVRARVLSRSSGGSAAVGIKGATVTFTSPATLTVRTDASGVARACWTLPAATSESIVASAGQQYFATLAAAKLSARTAELSRASRRRSARAGPSCRTCRPRSSGPRR